MYSNSIYSASHGGAMARKSREYDGEFSVDQIKSSLESIREQVGGPVREIRERLQGVEQRLAEVSGDGGTFHPKGAGSPLDVSAVMESDGFKRFIPETGVKNSGKIALGDLGIKSMLVNVGSTSDTSASEVPTGRDFIDKLYFPVRQFRLLDFLPVLPIDVAMVDYAQLRYDSEAAEVPEGEMKPETSMIVTPKTARAQTIAHWTRTSLQLLSDAGTLSQALATALRQGLLARLESQILNGSGTSGNIEGILPQVDFYLGNEQEKVDRIGAAIVQLQNLGFVPNVIVMNPTDWFQVQTAKTEGPEEFYRFGNPAAPLLPRLWNLPVVTTPSIAAGRVLVGDANYAAVLDRQQPTVELSREDRDNFVTNMVTILAELRAGLALFREDAFLKVKLDAVT